MEMEAKGSTSKYEFAAAEKEDDGRDTIDRTARKCANVVIGSQIATISGQWSEREDQ